MRVLGIETSCDETGVAVYDTDRGPRSRTRCTRRSRCTRPTAASCPSWRRATTCGASCRWSTQVLARGRASALRDLDGIAYTQGPGLAGALLVGASVASALAYALGNPGDRRPPPGRPPAVAAARRRRGPSFRSSRCWCRAATASSSTSRASAATGCSATRSTTRPARRSTRPRSCWACRIPAARRWRSSPSAARAGAVTLPRPMLDVRRSRFQLLGPQDRGAARSRASEAGDGVARDAADGAQGRHRARVPERGRRRAGREGAGGAGRDGPAARWSSPAASAPTGELRARLARESQARGAQRVSSRSSRYCTDNGAMIALVGALRLAAAQPPATTAFRSGRAGT